jgi:hypothetical protein
MAREDAAFSGSDQTARAHAGVLEEAKLLKRVTSSRGGIRYRATPEGGRIHALLVAARDEGLPRSAAEGPLLALTARPGIATLDALRLDNEMEYELLSALRSVLEDVEVMERSRIRTEPVQLSTFQELSISALWVATLRPVKHEKPCKQQGSAYGRSWIRTRDLRLIRAAL